MNTPFHSQTAFRLNSLAVLLAIGACALVPATSQGQTLISYNFNSLSNGNLVGQDSWALGAGAVSPTVASAFGSQALINASTTGSSIATKSFFTAGDVTTSKTVTLEFDAARTTPGGTNLSTFGIGTNATASSSSAYFGLASNTFFIRGENFGTIYDGNGTVSNPLVRMTATEDVVYTIRSVWDLSTGMATLFAKEKSAMNFTQITFNSATSVNLGITSDVSTWTNGWVRTAQSGSSESYLDNLSAVAIPEPGSILLVGASLAFLVLRRKRSTAA